MTKTRRERYQSLWKDFMADNGVDWKAMGVKTVKREPRREFTVKLDLAPGWKARLNRSQAIRQRNWNRMMIKTDLVSPHGNWLDEVSFQMGRLLGVYDRPTATDRLLRRG